MADEDEKAYDIALNAAGMAADLARGGDCSQQLPADTRAMLRAMPTNELIILRGELMQAAGKRYGVRNIPNPLTFVTALKLDGVRGLKRVGKGRTTDEQTDIIKRMMDEIAGKVPERTFFQKLFGRR
jgi:hypothetical protein